MKKLTSMVIIPPTEIFSVKAEIKYRETLPYERVDIKNPVRFLVEACDEKEAIQRLRKFLKDSKVFKLIKITKP